VIAAIATDCVNRAALAAFRATPKHLAERTIVDTFADAILLNDLPPLLD
jgi:hypothetical protein